MLYVVLAETYTEFHKWWEAQAFSNNPTAIPTSSDQVTWIASAYQLRELAAHLNTIPNLAPIHWVVLPNFFKRSDAKEIVELAQSLPFNPPCPITHVLPTPTPTPTPTQ